MFGDSLIRIRRTEATCLPLPVEISQRLLAGQEVDGVLTNNLDESGPPHRSYCVRCFVYRDSQESIQARQAERLGLSQQQPQLACKPCSGLAPQGRGGASASAGGVRAGLPPMSISQILLLVSGLSCACCCGP